MARKLPNRNYVALPFETTGLLHESETSEEQFFKQAHELAHKLGRPLDVSLDTLGAGFMSYHIKEHHG